MPRVVLAELVFDDDVNPDFIDAIIRDFKTDIEDYAYEVDSGRNSVITDVRPGCRRVNGNVAVEWREGEGCPFRVGDRVSFREERGRAILTGTVAALSGYREGDRTQISVRRDDGTEGGGYNGAWLVSPAYNRPIRKDHLMGRLGVPYAFGEWDDDKKTIVVKCPECGEEFPERFDPKADMGCGAMVSDYAQHYIDEHEENR